MHAAVGTALGGVTTLVGEPQNLLIGTVAGWEFVEFFLRMAPVSLPVLAVGFATCVLLEKLRWFGYGAELPEPVRAVLEDFDRAETANRTPHDRAVLVVQAVVAVALVVALGAARGGRGPDRPRGHRARDGVHGRHGRAPDRPCVPGGVAVHRVARRVLRRRGRDPRSASVRAARALRADAAAGVQPATFYVANGVLSAISDNVFVATVYISQVAEALARGEITREQFDHLAVAINTGTNIPSVATPNGQAAFLFLLTSSLAPLMRLVVRADGGDGVAVCRDDDGDGAAAVLSYCMADVH